MNHGQMPLVWNTNSWVLKSLIWSIFENNDASDDFLKTSELDTSECLRLIQKKKKESSWMLIDPKKNVREQKIA